MPPLPQIKAGPGTAGEHAGRTTHPNHAMSPDTPKPMHIDLRGWPLRSRASHVLQAYAGLAPAGAVEFISDEDPQPLFHALQATDPGGFTWDACVNAGGPDKGPSAWAVRVVRLSRAEREDTCCSHCSCA
jgi:uncharacterized protein (DUF2249 family)